METLFKVTTRSAENTDYIELHGNIDAAAEQQILTLPDQVRSRTVRFDFGKTGRINSMGIALLLRCLKRIREEKQAEILLGSLTPTNAVLFRMTGVFMLASQEK
jgi:anti-anti-sigma regulatory factor